MDSQILRFPKAVKELKENKSLQNLKNIEKNQIKPEIKKEGRKKTLFELEKLLEKIDFDQNIKEFVDLKPFLIEVIKKTIMRN